MIDIHLHILPGIDDGPATLQESLALAEVLVQEGVHTAVATSHYNDEFVPCPVAEIQERVYHLQQELNRYAIPLRIFAGHEALIRPGLVEDIQTGRLATLNGSRYLLLELWNDTWLPETDQIIFELRAYGITPILAHAERYRILHKNLERSLSLLRQGVLMQITSSSLLGMQGNSARHYAEFLLKKDMIHCIASDAHGLHKRPPMVARGIQHATDLVGRERVYQMVESWPAAIVNNEVISGPPKIMNQGREGRPDNGK